MKNTLLISAVALLLLAACQNDKNHQATVADNRTVFFDAADGFFGETG
jgi:putative endopeptidase